MVLFNYSTRELTAKVVYYGPGICGKTTNLQFIHENLPGGVRGKMLSLATKTDRTLFFDFLPIDLGEIRGMKTRVQLYTVHRPPPFSGIEPVDRRILEKIARKARRGTDADVRVY